MVLAHDVADVARQRPQLALAMRQVGQPAAEVAQERCDHHLGCGAEVRAPTQVPYKKTFIEVRRRSGLGRNVTPGGMLRKST